MDFKLLQFASVCDADAAREVRGAKPISLAHKHIAAQSHPRTPPSSQIAQMLAARGAGLQQSDAEGTEEMPRESCLQIIITKDMPKSPTYFSEWHAFKMMHMLGTSAFLHFHHAELCFVPPGA